MVLVNAVNTLHKQSHYLPAAYRPPFCCVQYCIADDAG